MQNKEAYDEWSVTYDSVVNKTRDVEARALRRVLATTFFSTVVEIGCGTGKNTDWLAARATRVIAVDFSVEMLNIARKKIQNRNVQFIEGDVTQPWTFGTGKADLVTCSLILEHIENIGFIFHEANQVLEKNGLFYIGELHPFKQYEGSKARFETASGTFTLKCYVHHLSEYLTAATQNGFASHSLTEWFDNDDKTSTPRIIALVFRKT